MKIKANDNGGSGIKSEYERVDIIYFHYLSPYIDSAKNYQTIRNSPDWFIFCYTKYTLGVSAPMGFCNSHLTQKYLIHKDDGLKMLETYLVRKADEYIKLNIVTSFFVGALIIIEHVIPIRNHFVESK